MKPLIAILLIAFFMTAAHSESLLFPSIAGKNLNENPWKAPDGFPNERTLVLIGFDEPQQELIDTWISGMKLKNPETNIAWIEMPVIENPGIFMRWFINTGMRGGIPDKSTRSRVWTAYTDRKAFLKACGITSIDTITVLVVQKDGKILASESGGFTEPGARKLAKAIDSKPTGSSKF
jgi:hypothetical protein